jgi:hypothetical protein
MHLSVMLAAYFLVAVLIVGYFCGNSLWNNLHDDVKTEHLNRLLSNRAIQTCGLQLFYTR